MNHIKTGECYNSFVQLNGQCLCEDVLQPRGVAKDEYYNYLSITSLKCVSHTCKYLRKKYIYIYSVLLGNCLISSAHLPTSSHTLLITIIPYLNTRDNYGYFLIK